MYISKKSYTYSFVLSASVAYACGGGSGGSGGSGCGTLGNEYGLLIHCEDADTTVLWYGETYCAQPPKEICSAYFHHGDESFKEDYPNAWSEPYNHSDHSGYPVPACLCDYGQLAHDFCLDDQNQSGEPTTGAPGEGGETTGEGGEDGGDTDTTGPAIPTELNICNKADVKCAAINCAFDPLFNDLVEC